MIFDQIMRYVKADIFDILMFLKHIIIFRMILKYANYAFLLHLKDNSRN
jgi:hypothetical protein